MSLVDIERIMEEEEEMDDDLARLVAVISSLLIAEEYSTVIPRGPSTFEQRLNWENWVGRQGKCKPRRDRAFLSIQ